MVDLMIDASIVCNVFSVAVCYAYVIQNNLCLLVFVRQLYYLAKP